MPRRRVDSGSPWEPKLGYSRAVRVGPLIFVSGTTSVALDGRVVHEGDAYAQAREALGRIGRALQQVGSRLEDIVATRIYLTDMDRWEEVGRAHGEVFGEIRPTSTLVEISRLVDPRMLVEIEAIAWVEGGDGRD
jgi:enamine deaminase RidA (YjgF/YER057c/UK114 family)